MSNQPLDLDTTKQNVKSFFQRHLSFKNIGLGSVILFTLMYLGGSGLNWLLGIAIHTIGLMNPVSKTYKLISQHVTQHSPRNQNDTTTTNNNDEHVADLSQETTKYLKFWISYTVFLFLATITSPILNLFVPANLFFNIFFLILLAQPATIGVMIYDRIVARILQTNIRFLDKTLRTCDYLIATISSKISLFLPEAILAASHMFKSISHPDASLQQNQQQQQVPHPLASTLYHNKEQQLQQQQPPSYDEKSDEGPTQGKGSSSTQQSNNHKGRKKHHGATELEQDEQKADQPTH